MASKNGETAKPGTVDDPVAHSVAVQLPTFNKLAPSAWFHLADANFHLRAITKSETKYWYIVSKLDADTLMKLSAFLAKSRGVDPYSEIRAVLCRTYEPKLEKKLDTLLATKDMGDERPAEFSLDLRRLLGEASAEDILKRIFLRSLPKPIRTAISGNLQDSFDNLADAADKAWALSAEQDDTPVVNSAQAFNHPNVSAVAATAGRGRGQRHRGGRQAKHESRSVVLCPFHLKWGDSARKCLPSCSRWEAKAPQRQVFQVEEAIDDEYPASEN